MVRDFIVQAASLLLLLGLAVGLAGQIELLKPGILFMSPELWFRLLPLHVWATVISLAVICLSTISLIWDRTALGQWLIWLGFAAIPLLIGALANAMLALGTSPDSYITGTTFVAGYRHAYGTAALLVALGGLSALQRVKYIGVPLKISFGFALLIAVSGVAAAYIQAALGESGMARQYIDYPAEFAPAQFYASVSAFACVCLSAIYVILLWRHKDGKLGIGEAVF